MVAISVGIFAFLWSGSLQVITRGFWQQLQRGSVSPGGDLGSGLHLCGLAASPHTCGLVVGLNTFPPSFLSFSFFLSFNHLYQCELIDIYFIFSVTIQNCGICSVVQVFQLWLLEAHSVDPVSL